MENERLKTTIAVLNGKIKSYKDSEELVDKLREQVRTLEDENLQLKSQISQFEMTIETNVFQITDLNVKLEESGVKNSELTDEL